MLLVGLMSGTSADGINAALVKVTGEAPEIQVKILGSGYYPYPADVREAILSVCAAGHTSLESLCALDSVLGELLADAAIAVVAGAKERLRNIHAICSHGQTIWHQPQPSRIGSLFGRGSLQIGSAAAIAHKTGRNVVSDFRSADIAAGGQGAPLVPFADWAMLMHGTERRLTLNLGGIANFTLLPAFAKSNQVVATDTGPGCMVMDAAASILTDGAKSYDEGGEMAARGKPNVEVVKELSMHPFFARGLPRSTGREDFGMQYTEEVFLPACDQRGLSADDALATAALFTVETACGAVERFAGPISAIDRIFVGGGGTQNPTLMRMLADRLGAEKLCGFEEYGFSAVDREAVAFAVLGYQTIRSRPSNLPAVTGASRRMVLGSVWLGTAFSQVDY